MRALSLIWVLVGIGLLVKRGDDAKLKTIRLVLDLGSRRPVDRVELDVAERNFHRVVTIEASDDRQGWRWAGTGSLSAIETSKLSDRQESLRFCEAPTRYLRLTIQNLDDRPLHVSAVRAAAVRRGLVFQAVPGQTYFLDYGHPSVNAPRYGLIRAFPYVASETIPIATLGPATRLAAPAARAWTESQPIVLWAVMAGAVLALGGLLLRLARQVR